MKIVHAFLRDLGGEFTSELFRELPKKLGEPIPEPISKLYSDYFTAVGLAPVRISRNTENVRFDKGAAVLTTHLKLFSYGVVLFEYTLSFDSSLLSMEELTRLSSVNIETRGHLSFEELFKDDLEKVEALLKEGVRKEYDIQSFNDHFIVYLDDIHREPDQAVSLLLPQMYDPSTPVRRHGVSQISVGEDNDHMFLLGQRAYISPLPDGLDILNFLELSRVQLFELKIYDYILDRAIENTYQFLDQLPREESIMPLSWLRTDYKQRISHVLRLTEIRMDLVDLVKDVTNTSKVTDDPFFATLYRNLNDTFQVSSWFQSVGDKIDEIDSAQKVIMERIDHSRATALEMTVIILILIEIILPVGEFIARHF
ncbi:MAG TPA: hypothetical protein PKM25_13360 [Candidatus Ozemobacteraceae bacterium]|nr:hypothetical protein [Candidatus Ozemobacteraceae bacterium]